MKHTSIKAPNLTAQEVGAHFWGLGFNYPDLEWARITYKVEMCSLRDIQEGWNQVENEWQKERSYNEN